MKKIYLIVGAMLWGGIVDAQTLSVEQYRQKVLEYNQDIQKSQQAVNGALYSLKGIKTGFFSEIGYYRKLFLSVGEGGVLARNRPETR